MTSFWDERFSGEDFVYGEAPNAWVAEAARHLPPGAHVLSLGEGEGRNAVWLAMQGHTVDAVDGSAVGLEKMQRLAAQRGVAGAIRPMVADLAEETFPPAAYDALLMVFVHLPKAFRAQVHARAQAALRTGGVVIAEFFTPRQLALESGGPKQVDMLYEPDDLRAELPDIEWLVLEERRIVLDEGPFHQGPAAVVRGVGRKR